MAQWILGLTGGIGSGKSAAAEHFARLGITVVDSDQVARQVVAPGQPALAQIAEHFGAEVLDGRGLLDRGALRQRIFQQPTERQWLEQLLHPLIGKESECQLQAATSPYAVLMSPLLLEVGLRPRVQRVLVIDVPEALQLQRVQSRDGQSAAQIKAIMAAQLGRAARLAQADDVLCNDGSLAALQQGVERLHAQYLVFSGASH